MDNWITQTPNLVEALEARLATMQDALSEMQGEHDAKEHALMRQINTLMDEIQKARANVHEPEIVDIPGY